MIGDNQYIEVEAVAILPLDGPVPDEWFPVLLAAELQREFELLEIIDESKYKDDGSNF